ncbi:hypothetical protein [Sodalis sp. dw_96]|nr:hypothetical protein [Sodalis sp. dw_96]
MKDENARQFIFSLWLHILPLNFEMKFLNLLAFHRSLSLVPGAG